MSTNGTNTAARPTDASRRWTTDVFGLDPSPVSVGGCTSQAYFEQELNQIFRKTWLAVGRETELPRTGSYLVHRIEPLSTSVIVTRDKTGRIRAFHNVCAHRCNRLLAEDRGETPVIFCRYHGWSFALDGRLIGVPDQGSFIGLEKERNGLVPVAVETWNGFIFINLDPHPKESLLEYIGDSADGYDGYPFAELSRCVGWKIHIKCNWKLIKDAFCELYHIPFLHKESSSSGFIAPDMPIPHALAFLLHKHGGQYSVFGNPQATYPPTPTLAFKHGTAIIKSCETMGDPAARPRLFNPSNSANWSGELMQVFPSLQLSLFPQAYVYHTFMPLTVDSALWEMRLYQAQPKSFSERFAQEYAAIQLRDGVMEDVTSTEGTQAVLLSGGPSHFNFSDQELLPRANHLMTQQMAGPYPPATRE